MSCQFNQSSRQSAAASRRSSGSQYQRSQSTVAQSNFNSQIEQAVINARQPIQVNERQEVQAGPYRGIYLNKQEVDQFRGPVSIDQYRINEDSNPEVIRKRLDKLRYKQEVAVKYLNPPPAPKPGDLVIRERQGQVPPAPPVVIRQEGCKAATPPPLVYREAPPRRPTAIPPQVVEVEGDPVAPPARRVVVEKLSNLPPKPQNILIEKWLPYKPQKRRVVYERSCAAPPANPRNLLIEWEAPEVEVEQVCRDLGVVDADPEEYRRQYGSELKQACEIPNLCQGNACPAPAPRLPTPPPPTPQCGCQAPTPRLPTPPACNTCGQRDQGRVSSLPELEGDVDALRRVDLEANGLGGYRRYFQ